MPFSFAWLLKLSFHHPTDRQRQGARLPAVDFHSRPEHATPRPGRGGTDWRPNAARAPFAVTPGAARAPTAATCGAPGGPAAANVGVPGGRWGWTRRLCSR